jgi:hypothetical protein
VRRIAAGAGRNGASGTSDMHGDAARVAESEPGGERMNLSPSAVIACVIQTEVEESLANPGTSFFCDVLFSCDVLAWRMFRDVSTLLDMTKGRIGSSSLLQPTSLPPTDSRLCVGSVMNSRRFS